MFTGEIILYCSRMSKSLFSLSCKSNGILLARRFLKIALGVGGRCCGECNLVWHNEVFKK